LERSVSHTDVLFICSLALYQCEDGLGPSIAEQVGSKANESPFRRVLEAISRDGRRSMGWSCGPALERLPSVLFIGFLILFTYPIGAQNCIPTPGGKCAYGTEASHPQSYLIATYCMLPKWKFRIEPIQDSYRWMLPVALVLLGLSLLAKLAQRFCPLYGGRMVAVPNHETDLYSRLWCMYEMYAAQSMGVPVRLANTLARAGACKCRMAGCSSQEDKARILADIDAEPLHRGVSVVSRITSKDGYERLDSAIWRITRRAQWTAWLLAFQWIVPFLAVRVAMTADEGGVLEKALTLRSNICVGIYAMSCAGLAVFAAVFAVVVLNRGRPPFSHLCLLSGCLIGFAMAMRALELSLKRRPAMRTWVILQGSAFAPQYAREVALCPGILCGGVSVLVLAVLARVVPRRFLPSPGFRRLIIASAILLALVGLTMHGVSLPTTDQYYPMAVWYLLFRLAPLVGFPSFMWVMAARWGVELAGTAELRRGADALPVMAARCGVELAGMAEQRRGG